MFNCRILRTFSILCLVRSSSQTSNPATIHFDECSSLTENNSYSQVSGESNYTKQPSKAAKRILSDLEGINDMQKNKLFASVLKENQTLIDSEAGQGDDGSLNIFEIKDRLNILDNSTVENQLDQLFSITIPVANSSDNSSNPSIENNDSEDFLIFKPTIDLQSISAHESTFITNSKDLNSPNISKQKYNFLPDRFKRIEKLEIYSDLREFIAKLIYFRKNFYEFINICLGKNDQENISESEVKYILQGNPEYEYLFTSHPNNEKSATRNLMLLIHLSLDFAKRIEIYFEVYKNYRGLTQHIYHQNKRIYKLENRLNNEKADAKTSFELKKTIECMKKKLSKFQSERESLPERPCFKIIFKYVRYLAKYQN
jgi:hypothetical protein